MVNVFKKQAIKVPIVFFVVAFIATTFFSFQLNKKLVEFESDEFKTISFQTKDHIQQVVESYLHPLQGIKGLIISSNFNLDPGHFRTYSEARNRHDNFPGSLGFGFIRYLKKNELPAYLKNKYKSNPNFKITSKGDLSLRNENYFIIDLIEPIEINSPALGLDVGSEYYRRSAAEYSMKSGNPIISHKIELVQVSKKQPGFLLLMPVYKTIQTPPTEAERIKNFYGWAYTPILFKEIIDHIKKSMNGKVVFSIYELSKNNIEEPINDELEISYQKATSILANFESKIYIGDRYWVFKSKYLLSGADKIIIFVPYILFFLINFINLLLAYFFYKNIELRLLAESSVKAKESELNTIINNIPLTISYWNKNQINIFSNNHYINICDKTPDQLKGTHIKYLFGDEGFSEVLVRVEKVLRGQGTTYEKEILLPATKEPRTILVHFVPNFNSQKEVVGFFLIGTDITEMKLIQKETDRANALSFEASKQASLGEMASGIAHEINNPLSIIKTLADSSVANLKRGRYDQERVEANFIKISSTVERVVKIVKGLKLIARNTDVEDFTNLSVHQILRETLDVCSEKIKYENIELKIEVENDYQIFARESEISQVFYNLISNAIEASSEAPNKWIHVSISSKYDKVFIKFSDGGFGVAKENLDKLFSPFFTTKQKLKKAGLGLSISKRILEEHKGNLSIDLSSKDTTFIVELPLLLE